MTRWLSVSARLQQRLDFVLHHAPDRHAGPVLDDRRHGLLVDAGQDQRRLALQRRELRLEAGKLGEQRRALVLGRGWQPRSAASQRRSAAGLARCGRIGAALSRRPCRSAFDALPSRRGPQRRADRRGVDPRACARPPTRFSSSARRTSAAASFSSHARRRSTAFDADRLFAADDLELGLQRLDRAAAIFELRRHGVLADRHARADRVQQADRLVGQLTRRDVAMRQPHRRLERLVEQLHAMVLLERRRDAAHHQRSPSPRSAPATCTTWKRRVSAGSFSMYFLYSAHVVAAIVRSVPRASAGLSRFAASPVPAAPPAPMSVCASSTNRMIGFGGGLHFVDHLAQPVLELALHAGAGLQQADVERVDVHVLERRRHVAAGDARRQSPRPRRSCRRRLRRSGSGCSAGGA